MVKTRLFTNEMSVITKFVNAIVVEYPANK